MPLKVTVLRHSISCAPTAPGYDAELATRRITDDGRQHAMDRLMKLGRPEFSFVFSSTAVRAIETADILCVAPDNNPTPVLLLRELCIPHPDTRDGKLMEELHQKLGNASLRAYSEQDAALMGRIGALQFDAMTHALDFLPRRMSLQVLVVGHGLLINALGVYGYDFGSQSDVLLDTVFGECEGFTFEYTDYRASDIQLIQG